MQLVRFAYARADKVNQQCLGIGLQLILKGCRCNGAVNFLLDWDKKGQYRLAALQSKAGSELLKQAGREPGDLSSVVLVEPGHAYAKSEAVLRIARRLNTPFYVLGSLGLPIPSFLRDAAYDLVRPLLCMTSDMCLSACTWSGI